MPTADSQENFGALQRPQAQLATTHWSVVLAAGQVQSPQAAAALEKLCRTYSVLITSLPYEDPAYDQSGNLANGDPPLPGETLIYEDNAGFWGHRYPITAPDGRQLTLAEWQAVRSEAHAQCVTGGTLIRLKLRGLVPHGVSLTSDGPKARGRAFHFRRGHGVPSGGIPGRLVAGAAFGRPDPRLHTQ